MARARLAGLGTLGGAGGRDSNAQPLLQRPSRPPPASSVSRAGKLPPFHLGGAAPGGGPCTAAHSAARPGTHRALGEGVDDARNCDPDAPSRRPQGALPAADPEWRGDAGGQPGTASAGRKRRRRPKPRDNWGSWGSARPVQQPGALEGSPGELTPFPGDDSLKTTTITTKRQSHGTSVNFSNRMRTIIHGTLYYNRSVSGVNIVSYIFFSFYDRR